MPRNTAAGIYVAGFTFLVGFGFVWHIVWLIVASTIGMITCLILRTFNDDTEYTVTATELAKLEEEHSKKIKTASGEGKSASASKDMGLREFISIVLAWALDVIRNKRWKKW